MAHRVREELLTVLKIVISCLGTWDSLQNWFSAIFDVQLMHCESGLVYF